MLYSLQSSTVVEKKTLNAVKLSTEKNIKQLETLIRHPSQNDIWLKKKKQSHANVRLTSFTLKK
jgi:hypothetical protein